MKTPTKIDVSAMAEYLTVDVETGRLYDSSGFIACYERPTSPYRYVRAFGFCWAAHRVVFALTRKRSPAGLVDHINGDPADNRPRNLREATREENLHNAIRYRRGGGKPVRAYIGPPDNVVCLGEFDSMEDARAYRVRVFNLALDRLHEND